MTIIIIPNNKLQDFTTIIEAAIDQTQLSNRNQPTISSLTTVSPSPSPPLPTPLPPIHRSTHPITAKIGKNKKRKLN